MFIDRRFEFLKALVNAPVIMSNGARVYDYSTESVISDITFNKAYISDFLEKIYSKFPDLPMEIYSHDTVTVINPDDRLYKRFEKLSDYAEFSNVLKIPCGDIIRIAIVDHDRNRITNVSEFVTSNTDDACVELVFSEWFIFEILPKGATKGNGINILREQLRGVKIISAGDWNNDISQLLAADIAVCPSNANEFVRDICKYVLCDCDHGLIADIVEYIEKGLFDI